MRIFYFTLLLFQGLISGQSKRPIATNISGITDYSTELVFTDAFKQCRTWTTFNASGDGPWDTGAEVPMLANGFPTEVPFDGGVGEPQKVRALMVWEIDAARPQGMYRLIVKGTGRVGLQFGAEGEFICPVDTLVQVNGSVSLSIEYSDKNDPIHDVQFIYPRYVNSFEGHTFHDDFLNFLKDFECLRFMDWQRTNNSKVKTWEDRSKVDFYTQATDNGIAYEYIVELCNLLKKNAWICIPHRADDEYIHRLAAYLHTNLDPSLTIYLEYSNEVWNGIFSQHDESAEMAQAAGYTGTNWERAWKWTAKRSADIFSIFENEFGSHQRLVRVIPTQAANSWLSNEILTFFNDSLYNPGQVKADALAIAPYFGGEVAQDIVNEGLISSITVPEIVSRMETSLPTTFDWMQQQKEVAEDHGMDLICYEGGQHLVGIGGNENIDELTEKLIAANHDPGLQAVYCQYFDYWYANMGGLFAHFSSHAGYSKWGSWGVKENFADSLNPKYLALKNCVFAHNGTTKNAKIITEHNPVMAYPNPSNSGEIHLTGLNAEMILLLTDITGQRIPLSDNAITTGRMTLNLPHKGVFILQVIHKGKTQSLKLMRI